MNTSSLPKTQNSRPSPKPKPRLKRVRHPDKPRLFYDFCLILSVLCGFSVILTGIFAIFSLLEGKMAQGFFLFGFALISAALIFLFRKLPTIPVALTREEVLAENAAIFFAMRCRLLLQGLLLQIPLGIYLLYHGTSAAGFETLSTVSRIALSVCVVLGLLNWVSALTLKSFRRPTFWFACASSYLILLGFVPVIGFFTSLLFRDFTWIGDLKKVAPYFHGKPSPK